ncbi:MAG: putative enzyme related to lactoylglutathione lyase [Bacteroidia bacterium]|jgi:predicted enzyme related to lactoylglutathione lyase
MEAINNYINYIEFKAKDIEATKLFYSSVFGWTFTDYGPDYVSFANSGLNGGFEKSSKRISNGALVVLYHHNLESLLPIIKTSGGKISKEIFAFPGGRRFQFKDPSGNELAVWSE